MDRASRTLLHYAARDANITEIVRLINEGMDVNLPDRGGWTALHFAAQANSAQACATLIAAGAHVNAKDHHGNTPLFRAVFSYRGDGGTVAALRAAGADPQITNDHGISSLALARGISNYDVAKHFSDL